MFFLCLSSRSILLFFFFFSSRRRHTRFSRDWSSDVCSSDLSYREHMQQFALMNHLDVWYYHLDVEAILALARGMAGTKRIQKRVEQASAKAGKRTRIETFPKLAEAVNGQYHIKDEPPLIFHYDPLDIDKNNLDTG